MKPYSRHFAMMKNLKINLLILSILCINNAYSQNDNLKRKLPVTSNSEYLQYFISYDSLININQTKSALELMKSVNGKAKTEFHTGYYIKSLKNMMICISNLEEYDELKAILNKTYLDELNSTKGEMKSLVYLEYSGFLANAFNSKRFKTITPNDTSSDPSDWALETLNTSINENILMALLLSEGVEFNDRLLPLFKEYAGVVKYDFVPSFKAMVAEASIGILKGVKLENIGEYLLPDTSLLFSEKESYLKIEFSNDSDPENKLKILYLYQILLKENQLHYDLMRYLYIGEILGTQNSYYLNALEKFHKASITDPYSNNIAYYIADWYISKDKVKALKCIDDALKMYPDFKMNEKLKSKKHEITSPKYSVMMEEVYRPASGSSNKMLVRLDVTNCDSAHFVIYKVNYIDYIKNYQRNYGNWDSRTKIWTYLNTLGSPVLKYSKALPEYSDYESHSVELTIPALTTGVYFVISSNKSNLKDKNCILTSTLINVSEHILLKSEGVLQIVDAVDGSPAKNYGYKLWKYNSKLQKHYIFKQGTTDLDGKIKIASDPKDYYRSLIFESNNGELTYDFYDYNYSGYWKKRNLVVKILTDRSIYRPGQDVFVKCIVYNEETGKVVPSKILKIQLQNGGDVKSELKLTSNKYGSVSGKLKIPKSGFNSGYFSVEVYGDKLYLGSANISVEEYKRPKYAVELMKPDSAYKVNDNVKIKGKAMALAGYAISDAEVTYKITRTVRIPYYSRYYWNGYESPVELKNGKVRTDEKGEFEFEFKALPKIGSESFKKLYDFNIEVSVTDINGEVRTKEMMVVIGETDRELHLYGKKSYLNDQHVVLNHEVKTLQDVPLNFTGVVYVYKVERGDELKRFRLWEAPDTNILTQEDYSSLSDYSLKDEKEIIKYIVKKVYQNDKSNSTIFDKRYFKEAGDYRAIMKCEDTYGDSLEVQYEFKIYGALEPKPSSTAILELYSLIDKPLEPGSVANIAVGSVIKGQTINIAAYSERGKIFEKNFVSDGTISRFDIPVLEKDRGNIIIEARTVSNYRLIRSSIVVNVPYSNKQLQVSMSSFRSDMEPGSKEKWKIKLKGPLSEKAAMELAAVMYDAALDEIKPHNTWNFWLYNDFSHSSSLVSNQQMNSHNEVYGINSGGYSWYEFHYPKLGLNELYNDYRFRRYSRGFFVGDVAGNAIAKGNYDLKSEDDETNAIFYDADGVPDRKDREKATSAESQPRKNFNETAFFLPQLYADPSGEVSLEFSMPESLTKWRLLLLAHSTTMQLGYHDEYITTSKKLMLQPNIPRFFRQNDKISIASKVVNTTKKDLNVKVGIKLTDAADDKVLNWVKGLSEKTVTVKAGQSIKVSFDLEIPSHNGIVSVSINANSGEFSDGELHTLPILSNRILVHVSMPITVRNSGVRDMEFTSLLKNTSTSLVTQQFTVEMCNRPAWNAIMSLPYMMEYPNECAEQLFTRLYANSIAFHLANKDPEIKKVYEQWVIESKKGNGFQSKLSSNEDLKTSIISETPWLMEAKNETERMQKMGRLFEQRKMKDQIEEAFNKLKSMQSYSGAFPWFGGMEDNEYITQTIVIGFGKMKAMGIDVSDYQKMIDKAIKWLDERASEDYIRYKRITHSFGWHPVNLNYLYCKSYFPNIGLTAQDSVLKFYIDSTEKYWSTAGLMNMAQIATALKVLRPSSKTPSLIIKAFDENSKKTDEMGMFWPKNVSGWYWYHAPLETQAAIIEAYAKCSDNKNAITEQQIWLLRQKQTQSWSSTRSTADACFALLAYGNQLANQQDVSISINGTKVNSSSTQAGTGYWRTDLPANTVKPDFGKVRIEAKTSDFAYGAIHWQYFEDMDKVTGNTSGLTVYKKYYVFRQMNGKTEQIELKAGDSLKVGDILKVVISVSSDRNLEFVHVKDLRASGTEPTDVLSTYKWENGLGYYQSTKDVSSNFFIDRMNKGRYQISYTLSVQQQGVFECGIASVQCMYAPEFTANSTGFKLIVGE